MNKYYKCFRGDYGPSDMAEVKAQNGEQAAENFIHKLALDDNCEYFDEDHTISVTVSGEDIEWQEHYDVTTIKEISFSAESTD